MDKTLTDDGCPGPITDAALHEFLKQQGAPEDAIPKDRAELTKSVADALGLAG